MDREAVRGVVAAMLVLAGVQGGCSKPGNPEAATNDATPSMAERADDAGPVKADGQGAQATPTDRWIGRWTGPEGLFLDIQPSPDGRKGHYAIANRDTLDREADYAGVADGETIRFTRDGKTLAVRAGSGAETGFKYLVGKSDCLIVVPGREGYCR